MEFMRGTSFDDGIHEMAVLGLGHDRGLKYTQAYVLKVKDQRYQ